MGIVSYIAEKLSLNRPPEETTQSIYDFKPKTLDGVPVDFSQFRGRPLLIVNVASKCGYTHQYADLQRLHERYGDKISVLGFPANNFLWQEPGSNQEIASFCRMNYGVTFPVFEKISVKGSDKHPVYKWLHAKTRKEPSWNFCKYIVSPDGTKVEFFGAKVNPLDVQIVDKINSL
jgi:glutathione peroxidase